MKGKYLYLFMGLTMACSGNHQMPDAYGNFEATEIRVPAMASGRIIFLSAEEGTRVEKGQVLGQIDTTHLHLRKEQLRASYVAALARKPGITTQTDVLEDQKRSAEKELKRFRRLAEEGAVAQKQADDLADHISLIDKQIKNIKSQHGPLIGELKVIETQMAQIDQQIADSRIIAPLTGVILTKLAEAHEFVNIGSHLYRIADLDTLILKAYVSGAQLREIILGQPVKILVDKNIDSYEQYPGTISWIASTAEFTPKTIQTKDERTSQVYAIKIKVPNPEGIMKIGMPGEVLFTSF
jgi:HlyD family secretion protein